MLVCKYWNFSTIKEDLAFQIFIFIIVHTILDKYYIKRVHLCEQPLMLTENKVC